ncbi:MAG: hypothetical protein CR976_01370 [Thiotrichales bacterium]|nr:MAG: hypothetical protein CR976_01370 [Thiotrichales bacterium]
MTEKKVTNIMHTLMFIGVAISLVGVGLILFTNIATSGASGVAVIAGLIAGGLFLSVPAKLYLTFQLMKKNDEKLRARRQREQELSEVFAAQNESR